MRMRKLVIFGILLIILMSSVFALGVARPTFSGNRLVVGADEEEALFFQLQNGDTSSKTVLFKVTTQSPAKIKLNTTTSYSSSEFQAQYVLGAKSIVSVNLDFIAPDGIYKVDYSIAEASTGNGSVKFDTKLSDYFLVKSGAGSFNYLLGIPLSYSNYDLKTSSESIKFIDDLQVESDFITIDYRGKIIDLTGFLERFIMFEDDKVTVDSVNFSELNKPAKLIFSNINSPYKILKNGVECPASVCSVISYVSKRLIFSVPGFSSYQVVGVQNMTQNTTQNISHTNGASSSTGTSGGVAIPPKINNTKINSSKGNGASPAVQGKNNQPSQTSSSGQVNASLPSSNPAANQKGATQIATPLPNGKNKVMYLVALVGIISLVTAIILFRRGELDEGGEENENED